MKKYINRENLFTIPNAISLFRLLLIPLFTWLYLNKEAYMAALAVIAVSGLSDIVDGKIARHYNMVSDFGKMFDPVVDKLTQAAMFFCLLSRFPNMLIPLIVHAIKEITTGIMSLMAINKTNVVEPAEWPGKLTTVFLYATAMIHILWTDITTEISDIIIGISVGWMLFAFAFYGIRNLKILCSKQRK
ncbi:MAG: CDP-alcohol phosphatidyltransferase family protein [Clostridia bacterium]|nr:CDP-alcohol phosphatidyltransferase family protein [Clostridia bacterium]